MPKSLLRYVLDKGQYFDPETSCFPNKETDGRWRGKQLFLPLIAYMTVTDVQYCN